MPASVAVVVLTWNHVDDTLECLASVARQRYNSLHTIVVDNGSSDDTVSRVRAEFPTAELLLNQRNLGYAAGNNVGLRHALGQQHEYVMVLNNDTVLEPDCIGELVSDLRAHPETAAVAPKILFDDAPHHIYYAGGVISGGWHVNHRGFAQEDSTQFDVSESTAWLTGCAVLMRRESLRRIGMFEPKFFLLFEDTDWSSRALAAGYTLRYVAPARLRHKVSRGFGSSRTPLYIYYYTRNNLLWIERTFSWRQKRWMLRDAIRFGLDSPILREGNPSPERAPELKRAAQRGVRDYVLRRFGKRM